MDAKSLETRLTRRTRSILRASVTTADIFKSSNSRQLSAYLPEGLRGKP